MSDQGTPNGADTQPKGLREVAEAAWDEVVEQASEESTEESTQDESEPSGQPRDERGRWIPKSPEGVAAAPEPPSPSETTQEPEQPHPAPVTPPPGEAAQAPANWSAEDRANFEKLPQEGKQFLLKRHSEMESDYQKRVQATAMSNQMLQAIAPVFNDFDISSSLNRLNMNAIDAIHQWGAFYKRSINQDPRARIELLFEMADRMALDPAAVFGHLNSRSPETQLFTKEELANPAVKRFADHLGQLNQRLSAQESALQQSRAAEETARVGASRAQIDAFANAKNADGTPAHPYFDAVLPIAMEHYKANPTWSIEQCYQAAIEPLLGPMQQQAQASVAQAQNVARAQAAVRSNVRGNTAPVSRPAPPEGKRGLRQVMEEAAEEIGFNG
jgi:hypothetical protein